ncbi:MAG: Cfr10I/Bse634I family restriction endonuclease [Colwellia sp.]|nr:Cfr10I/Bse634I family restriction endonuclease [Colwellia sp.]
MIPRLVKQDRNGKPVVDTKAAFIAAIDGKIPTGEWDYDTHLNYIQKLVQTEDPRVTAGAISNCRGAWFEWMVAIDIYNHWCTEKHHLLMLPLPNIMRFDCATLYQDNVSKYIFDLRKKLKASLDIELITSNPDFVIFDTNFLNEQVERKPITNVDEDVIEFIDNLFRRFVGICSFTDIIGYMATKTSLRPDRRLQIVHEGSLTKAMYVHLQTRLWIDKPRTIKYFGASLKLNDKDRRALKTVATHSITTVLSEPERAVDECFELSSRCELIKAIGVMKGLLFQ